MQTFCTTSEDTLFASCWDPVDISDRIAAMRQQEETTYRCTDYFDENKHKLRNIIDPVDEYCRSKMCEWFYQVIDFCSFRRETAAIAMSYLDRYLCTSAGKTTLGSRPRYQLAAMTALYIAIKIHEPIALNVEVLTKLSQGLCCTDDFVAMEKEILEALEWRLGGAVTPLAFVRYFVMMIPSTTDPSVSAMIMDCTQYQTEIAVGEKSLIDIRPSVVAFAALLNAMDAVAHLFPPEARKSLTRSMEHFVGVTTAETFPIQSCLGSLLSRGHSGANVIEPDSDDELEEATLAYQQGNRGSPVSVRKRTFVN